MIFDYDTCFCSGCQREVPRDRRCGPTFREQIDELRSRLQALEQNTVPAGSAKQEPRAREWWIKDGRAVEHCNSSRNLGYLEGWALVREVLDD